MHFKTSGRDAQSNDDGARHGSPPHQTSGFGKNGREGRKFGRGGAHKRMQLLKGIRNMPNRPLGSHAMTEGLMTACTTYLLIR
jgi:hypothetical protein